MVANANQNNPNLSSIEDNDLNSSTAHSSLTEKVITENSNSTVLVNVENISTNGDSSTGSGIQNVQPVDTIIINTEELKRNMVLSSVADANNTPAQTQTNEQLLYSLLLNDHGQLAPDNTEGTKV